MDTTDSWTFLESLWCGIPSSQLVCYSCNHHIRPENVLGRTFSVCSTESDFAESKCTTKIPVPALSAAISVYHRHLECLLRHTRYVTVSHVWDAPVADLQYNKSKITSLADEVRNAVLEVPTRIGYCLLKELEQQEPYEIWHDYISVPQWCDEFKSYIIQRIPTIFNKSITTVAHLSDVDAHSASLMRDGASLKERARGISNFCNSKWFSRVWIAMEFTQSPNIRVMLRGYTLLAAGHNNFSIVRELEDRQVEGIRKAGSVYAFERLVGMGTVLVPWQLGPLVRVRQQCLNSGVKPAFAIAHQLLKCRCVTNPRDFIHALLGLTKPEITESNLSSNNKEAIWQIARSCLEGGDFSPLFMTPASALVEPTDHQLKSYGYNDLAIFGLGVQTYPPTYPKVRFASGNPCIRAEFIGTVKSIKQRGAPNVAVLNNVSMTIETTGVDAREFVSTLGARLYGKNPSDLSKHLLEGSRIERLRQQLSVFRNASTSAHAKDVANQIAENIGLKKFPSNALTTHGATLHLERGNAVVCITCSRCHRDFLFRVASLRPPSQLVGARAYSVPGLKYRGTHAGGCGLLIKEGRTVGRFVWGTSTCECDKLEEVEVFLEELPSPTPNAFSYGQMDNEEWLSLSVGQRLPWVR
ncbi:hypothetical protein F5Y16DRAFT_113179 [Xylariaceae sp. FL0255]|nr:hypothetical protein F5Y16DRAFT_113179 [Xylariaceae sp. FL0255]